MCVPGRIQLAMTMASRLGVAVDTMSAYITASLALEQEMNRMPGYSACRSVVNCSFCCTSLPYTYTVSSGKKAAVARTCIRASPPVPIIAMTLEFFLARHVAA